MKDKNKNKNKSKNKSKNKDESIQIKLSKSYFILVGLLLLFTAAFILPAQLRQLNNSLEEEISQIGLILSKEPEIISGMEDHAFSPSISQMLDELMEDSEGFDYIVFADQNSVRIYHPDKKAIGEVFAGGDEGQILKDATPYITTKKGEHDVQRRSFHQIQNKEGKVLGFVMVSASLSTVRAAQGRIILKFLLVFACLFLIGMVFAAYTSRHIRRSLLGYEPATMTRMFIEREEILENIDEGLLAYDLSFKKIYWNQAAASLLGTGYELTKNSDIYSLCQKCLDKQETVSSIPHNYQGKNLLLSILPLFNKESCMGFLIMLRDRTEMLELADQLTGSTHIVEALRASTHEFLNKLHIISGMLQMENYKEAISFIDGLSQNTKNSYQTTIQQIQNKTIAALLLGKQSRARELCIDFVIQKDSYLDAHNEFLSTQELVTLVGNLIENAFHAVEDSNKIRQVQFFINQTSEGLTIITDDTGCGMTGEQIQDLMHGNFTTRGEGHGIGFRLIREIVSKHQGQIFIDSEPSVGSSFTISIQH